MYADCKHINSPFIEGCYSWDHITSRLTEHENSKYHQNASAAYFRNKKGASIKCDLTNRTSARKKQILKRRAVLSSIIDAVFFLAMQGLPFRGKQAQNLQKAFEKCSKNAGNFYEVIKLLADYVPELKEHLEDVLKNF